MCVIQFAVGVCKSASVTLLLVGSCKCCWVCIGVHDISYVLYISCKVCIGVLFHDIVAGMHRCVYVAYT